MSEDQAISVSKGVFAFKGKSKRVREEDFITDSKDKGKKRRLDLYHELWEDVHTQIEILRSDMNCQIFDDLIKFVSGCHKKWGDSEERVHGLVGEIPTAVLVTGVNTPDHDVMFTNLQSMLKTKMSPLVARVGSHDNTRISSLLSNVVAQFMNLTPTLEDKDEDDNINGVNDLSLSEKTTQNGHTSPIKLKTGPKRKNALNLTMLGKWYKKTFLNEASTSPKKASCSPRKKPKPDSSEDLTSMNGSGTKNNQKPLLIIVFEDVENVNPSVFQDFISLCSSYLSSLPIVLILGIATAVNAIHQILPSAITSLLCMETFQAPPASQYLSQLMDKMVITPNLAFKLGPKVFHFLLDTFLYHDFSILNFVMSYQFCMSEHFLNNPLSILCSTPDEVDSLTTRLSQTQLDVLRKEPTFKSYVESCPLDEQNKLWSDNAFTKRQLVSVMKDLHQHHENLFPGLNFLHSLALDLPKHPLGKQFRELFSACLTSNLCESDNYKQTLTFLRLMSLDDLSKAMSKSLHVLEDVSHSNEDVQSLSKDVKKFIYRLDHLEDEIEYEDQEDLEGNADGVLSERILPQRTKLHELKEKLQAMNSKRRKSPYEKLREEIMTSLDTHFKKLIVCPLSLPLYEAVYFNDLSLVKDQLKAAPRCSMQRALTLPGNYLKCSCCQGTEHSILPTMPDICIVYKLHLECGTLVNLFDWLQAFVTIVTAKKDNGKLRKPSKPSNELRARFIRAVSELQFLGFIKSTKRKTDHVTRLTW